MDFKKIFQFIPEVRKPEEKKLSFNVKLKWTLIVLASFFVLANIPLFGLSNNALDRFKYLAIILGTDFGSIISLGIGPIVMASVILQLLTGSGIINIDTANPEGRKFFQGIQRILTFFFIIFEALIYVLMQGLQAAPGLAPLLIFQLILGGTAIFYMDDLMSKWGFGSGVSLFIGAGASWQLVTSALQFMTQEGKNCLLDFGATACPGKLFVVIQSVINKYPVELISALGAIIATIIIFLVVVFAQSLKVEVPLSYGRLRGYSIKWPLQFFYSSNMPVILTSALIVSFQVFAGIIENAAAPCLIAGGICAGMAQFASYFSWMGHFVNGQAVSGLAFWMGSTNLLELIIRGGFLPSYLLQGLTHTLFYVSLSTVFAVFWVKTSGYDAKTQAHKIASSGLQIAGFRQDERVLESILDRYIMPLTIMGGMAVGLLASLANLMGALISGTAILLSIMIFFQFYQSIVQQHQEDMNPAFRKFMKT
ncbi:Protein translocase subunit SecY [uncultured archaeon]|nr:Protein translocase subunit SecY [uncultured archaeon]